MCDFSCWDTILERDWVQVWLAQRRLKRTAFFMELTGTNWNMFEIRPSSIIYHLLRENILFYSETWKRRPPLEANVIGLCYQVILTWEMKDLFWLSAVFVSDICFKRSLFTGFTVLQTAEPHLQDLLTISHFDLSTKLLIDIHCNSGLYADLFLFGFKCHIKYLESSRRFSNFHFADLLISNDHLNEILEAQDINV